MYYTVDHTHKPTIFARPFQSSELTDREDHLDRYLGRSRMTLFHVLMGDGVHQSHDTWQPHAQDT